MSKISKVGTPHQVIEGKLLVALNDADKVAVVLDQPQLEMLIICVRESPKWLGCPDLKDKAEFYQGLRDLYKSAFMGE